MIIRVVINDGLVTVNILSGELIVEVVEPSRTRGGVRVPPLMSRVCDGGRGSLLLMFYISPASSLNWCVT